MDTSRGALVENTDPVPLFCKKQCEDPLISNSSHFLTKKTLTKTVHLFGATNCAPRTRGL